MREKLLDYLDDELYNARATNLLKIKKNIVESEERQKRIPPNFKHTRESPYFVLKNKAILDQFLSFEAEPQRLKIPNFRIIQKKHGVESTTEKEIKSNKDIVQIFDHDLE